MSIVVRTVFTALLVSAVCGVRNWRRRRRRRRRRRLDRRRLLHRLGSAGFSAAGLGAASRGRAPGWRHGRRRTGWRRQIGHRLGRQLPAGSMMRGGGGGTTRAGRRQAPSPRARRSRRSGDANAGTMTSNFLMVHDQSPPRQLQRAADPRLVGTPASYSLRLWEHQAETRSSAGRALHFDLAVVQLDDAVDHRQADPAALSPSS